MVVAQLQFARRAHHAAALDAADRRDLQGHVATGDIIPRRAKHAEHAWACIGRTADDLDLLTGARVDGEDLQLVGLWVLFRGEHPRNLGRARVFLQGW